MKTGILGLVVSMVLLISACAHGLLGWPPFRDALLAKEIEPQLVDALAVGWFFGTASMLAFAGIVLRQALDRLRGKPVAEAPLWFIATTYVVFGGAAFVFRNFNGHFLLFVATGVLIGIFNLFCRSPTDRARGA